MQCTAVSSCEGVKLQQYSGYDCLRTDRLRQVCHDANGVKLTAVKEMYGPSCSIYEHLRTKANICARPCAYARARSHTHTHTHTRARARARAHTHTHTHAHAHAHTQMHTHTHTTQTRECTHSRTHTHTHTRTHTCTHAFTHAHTHTRMRVRPRARNIRKERVCLSVYLRVCMHSVVGK